MMKEQVWQDSPLPSDPERAWTSSDSSVREERNEHVAGQATQRTTQQFCGLDYPPLKLESRYKKK